MSIFDDYEIRTKFSDLAVVRVCEWDGKRFDQAHMSAEQIKSKLIDDVTYDEYKELKRVIHYPNKYRAIKKIFEAHIKPYVRHPNDFKSEVMYNGEHRWIHLVVLNKGHIIYQMACEFNPEPFCHLQAYKLKMGEKY